MGWELADLQPVSLPLKTNSNWFKYPIKPNWYWISIDQYRHKTVWKLADFQPVSLPLNLHGNSAAYDHLDLLYFASGLFLAVTDSAADWPRCLCTYKLECWKSISGDCIEIISGIIDSKSTCYPQLEYILHLFLKIIISAYYNYLQVKIIFLSNWNLCFCCCHHGRWTQTGPHLLWDQHQHPIAEDTHLQPLAFLNQTSSRSSYQFDQEDIIFN